MPPKGRYSILSPGFYPHLIVLFLVFLSANTILSYFSWPISLKLWIILLGIVLPFAMGLFLPKREGEREALSFFKNEKFPIPSWAWLLAACLGIFMRFYRLADLGFWPTKDEGNFGFSALELNRQGAHPFFYGIGEVPPLFRDLLALHFKIFTPSLFSLWLFPALLSLITLPIGYWSVRRFVSRSVALTSAFFFACGFWPVILGRFCMGWIFLLLWECLLIGLFGSMYSSNSKQRRVWSLLLGACVGTGFYISPPHWAPAALIMTTLMTIETNKKPDEFKVPFVIYFSTAFAFFLPFGWAVISEHYGSHVQELWASGGIFSLSDRFYLLAQNVSVILWGIPFSGFNYGPIWGGLLNPVSGSLLLVGLLELIRLRTLAASRWMAVASAAFLAPAFLSHDLEVQRVMMILPIAMVSIGLGSISLFLALRRPLALGFLTALFSLSTGLDLYHLAGPYARVWLDRKESFQTLKSEESFRAYRLLKQQEERDGPGYLFLDFVSVPLDQSLTVASYAFNVFLDPALEGIKPTWAAVLTNINYQPFLSERFPAAQWSPLGSQRMPWDGELLLGIITINNQNQGVIQKWREAQPGFHFLTSSIVSLPTGRDRQGVLRNFISTTYPRVQSDPFLQSCFWEAVYFNHSADGKFNDSLNDLNMIFLKGYPAAHIYNELGSLLYFKKDYPDAHKAFLKAVHLGGEHTFAEENLKMMTGSR